MLGVLEQLFHALIAAFLCVFIAIALVTIAEKTPHNSVCERKVQWTSLTN